MPGYPGPADVTAVHGCRPMLRPAASYGVAGAVLNRPHGGQCQYAWNWITATRAPMPAAHVSAAPGRRSVRERRRCLCHVAYSAGLPACREISADLYHLGKELMDEPHS